MNRKGTLLALLCLALLAVVPATAADDSVAEGASACETMNDLEALEAECEGRTGVGWALGQRDHDAPKCRLNASAIFWTANDWVLLAEELGKRQGDCVHYYISIPPLAANKTGLRVLQDDVIRSFGPPFIPVAEVTLGDTGWAKWVRDVPGRTWFGAGVEMRKRMVAAGYDFTRGETWLLNEADRSTRRDGAPYPRQAIRDIVRGLAVGDGTGPVVPGIVELGIQYSHQTIPDLSDLKQGTKSLLADGEFWNDISPYVGIFAREAYADARRWGVAGSSLHEREEHLNDYFMHLIKLADDGPAEVEPARRFLRDRFVPFVNATWPARSPEEIPLSAVCPEVYVCGHGWTKVPLEQMLTFVTEEIYAVRSSARKEHGLGPDGHIGFSWQPTNNFNLPPTAWDAAKRTIAARVAGALSDAYGTHDAAPKRACGSLVDEDWCTGADVPDAFFTEAWAQAARWD